MLEHFIVTWLPEAVSILEIIGIIVIFVGSIKAFVHYVISICTQRRFSIKIELANALALGLEFKMGAEILKTVLIREMSEIYILGAIILLRAFLTVLIHFEVKAEMQHGDSSEASLNNY
ncbi:MAG: DUF1622 domain-containing protein [Erysipelotrichaceae bacterium]|jgi:uncharacterized membrane protein|nr:DUF1622 domain-containing protein [Erysipelotrichaceae bacterium]